MINLGFFLRFFVNWTPGLDSCLILAACHRQDTIQVITDDVPGAQSQCPDYMSNTVSPVSDDPSGHSPCIVVQAHIDWTCKGTDSNHL